MPKLIVITSDGNQSAIEGKEGAIFMELMRDNGIDELVAQCGGTCSCGTCHVWVAEEFLDRLPAIEEQEEDMLSSLETRQDNSRLSCQLRLTEALDGITVEVVPSYY